MNKTTMTICLLLTALAFVPGGQAACTTNPCTGVSSVDHPPMGILGVPEAYTEVVIETIEYEMQVQSSNTESGVRLTQGLASFGTAYAEVFIDSASQCNARIRVNQYDACETVQGN